MVVGLLASSVLMVVTRLTIVKLLPFLGFLVLSYVRHYPLKQLPAAHDYEFFQTVAILGGLLYLFGADRAAGNPKIKPL